MSGEQGKLYVVATPIGNLGDFSMRAVETLREVDLIAAEDTRHIQPLMKHYGIQKRIVSLHQNNEQRESAALVKKLQAGLNLALVSDAGTPLLSDPGMPLVKLSADAGIDIVPIPGACALIAALSVSGLPLTRFVFEGFPPRTSAARKAFFSERLHWDSTWVFYESCHRILETVRDMAEIFPQDRRIVVARELTKLYETVVRAGLSEVIRLLESDDNMRKGEFVVIVEGAPKALEDETEKLEQRRILTLLLKECSLKTAVSLAVDITGGRKKELYQMALQLSKQQ